nr:hypothetical protein [Micromonospora sp. DSM 115978]
MTTLAALVTFPSDPADKDLGQPSWSGTPIRSWSVRYVLDALMISGSVFLLVWSTVLSVVVTARVRGGEVRFAFAVFQPASGLVIVSVALLVAVFRRPHNSRALGWLVLGLTA